MKTIPLDESILCRASVQLAPTATGEMMYMPGGLHAINPFDGGAGQPITVMVDRASVAELNRQHAALMAKGKRPYFDFNHEDGEASFWPAEFAWQDAPEPGIYARGEWSADGKRKVEGKAWRQFSPVFHVDKKRGTSAENPARIVARDFAKPNMGGLVNDPAFHAISPLWAKQSAGAPSGQQHQTKTTMMTEQEIAALQAKILEQQRELDALKAKESEIKIKKENTDLVAAQIRALDFEKKHNESVLEIESLKAKSGKLEADAKARIEKEADDAVKAAVARGALPPKDEAIQAKWKGILIADPSAGALLAGLHAPVAASAARLTGSSSVAVVKEAPNKIMQEFGAILAKNKAMKLSAGTHKEKGKLAMEAYALFAKEIKDDVILHEMDMTDVTRALSAADYSDPAGAVGLLSGTLVLMRSLPNLMFDFPILSTITTDFSDAPGLLNQTEMTRIVLQPPTQTWDATLDSAGRPKGWDTVSPAQAVNVPVTLSTHLGVPIVFGADILSSTIRNLFAESAPQALNAIGQYMAQTALGGLMTPTNFNAYKANSLTSGNTTSGSTAITFASSSATYPGQAISGTGIPANTYIASVGSATAATLTQAATATVSDSSLTFTLNGGLVPTNYPSFVSAQANFNKASMDQIASAFDSNKVPQEGRGLLLNSQYFGQLLSDPALTAFFAGIREPGIVTDRKLPKLAGMLPINAPWLPSANSLVGFGYHQAALIMKTRLPNDFTKATGAMVPGSVTTVSVPGGFSVMLVEYVNLTQGYAEWRPEVLLGSAKGDTRCGLCVTSA